MDGQWLGLPARDVFKLGVGIAVALLLATIIFGGVRRIATFAEVVVPFMAGGFILMAITVMALTAARVPEMFSIIIASAFGAHRSEERRVGKGWVSTGKSRWSAVPYKTNNQ